MVSLIRYLPRQNHDVFNAGTLLSARCTSHPAALQTLRESPDQVVNWNMLISTGKKWWFVMTAAQSEVSACGRISGDCVMNHIRRHLGRMLSRAPGNRRTGFLTSMDRCEDALWLWWSVAALELFNISFSGKKAAIRWSWAAWAARLIVLSCGQVISELLVLITLHYHRIPREASVSCKVVFEAL